MGKDVIIRSSVEEFYWKYRLSYFKYITCFDKNIILERIYGWR